jgi:hypothetical protein
MMATWRGTPGTVPAIFGACASGIVTKRSFRA